MKAAYLRQALDLARQGEGQASPNPLVGAVLVRDDHVVGRGFHTYVGVKHAEIRALEAAGAQAKGAALYINLEPCSHRGRTGPCADALIAAGVTRVVAAMQDPNPLVSGKGFEKLRAAGVEVEIAGEFSAEAGKLNEAFVHFMKTGRPLVTLKTAMTLDGKIAARAGESGWISSEAARKHAQRLRHASDAILTGIGTVLADNCFLTDRTGLPRSRPLLRMVADSKLRIPLDSNMVSSCGGDVVVIGTSASSADKRQALEERGVRVLNLEGSNQKADLGRIVQWTAEQKYLSLLLEAGGELNGAALDAGIVDKIFFYYAPKIFSSARSLPMSRGQNAVQLERIAVHAIGSDEFAVEGYVRKENEGARSV